MSAVPWYDFHHFIVIACTQKCQCDLHIHETISTIQHARMHEDF